ncbi:N-acetyltransferase [Streptomyces griseoviridis]|uniref:N-acetyltransferase n=1 Tax=Streptomyces griseoviridis TaxID=45398 RepID=A0A3Q9KQV2_STRGD|nr:GNAT family protein [Streptomyces griseoviridis]AZS87251.1 N-acetyltransferase [Streptomyces griseoviridis]QCN85896.1 GNAT family N-acetyltransferase [Streptomyces griseoviridis]
MYPIERSSPRLCLRELDPADTEDVLAIYGSPKATEHLSFEPRTRSQVAEVIARSVALAAAEARSEYALAVVQRDLGKLIGFGRLALDPHQVRGATVGFALRPDMWGLGYGLEAVNLLLAVGFIDLGLHRIWGARSPLNHASARTLAAAGMVEEGTIREHVFKAGEWRDSVVHGIIFREWRERNPDA